MYYRCILIDFVLWIETICRTWLATCQKSQTIVVRLQQTPHKEKFIGRSD